MSNGENWYERTDEALCGLNNIVAGDEASKRVCANDGKLNDPILEDQTSRPLSAEAVASTSMESSALPKHQSTNSTLQFFPHYSTEALNSYSATPLFTTTSHSTITSSTYAPIIEKSFLTTTTTINHTADITPSAVSSTDLTISNNATVSFSPTTTFTAHSTTNTPPITTRGLTVLMMMKDGLLKPGREVLSYESKGEVIRGDLMEEGQVLCRQSLKVVPSVSAWVVACRKELSQLPASCPLECVRYKDKSLEAYKAAWFKKHKPFKPPLKDGSKECDHTDDKKGITKINTEEEDSKEEPCTPGMRWLQECALQSCMMEEVSVARLGRRCLQGQANVLVECANFSASRIQPFTTSISSNCLLLMHLHCHLLSCEAIGYMAGRWDSTKQHLHITQSYPCKCLSSASDAQTDLVEYELMSAMEHDEVVLAGWYHSHNRCQSNPSLRDVELQMEHQFQLKGLESSSFQPCFSFIISPFYVGSNSTEGSSDSKLIYVHPPPEQRPLEYGSPIQVEYTVDEDDAITTRTLKRMRELINYWKEHGRGADKLEGRTADGNKGDYWVPGMFAPEEMMIFTQRLKQAIVRFCPGRKIDRSMTELLGSI